jgi:hypothetical protein
MVEPCKGSDEHIIIELDARSARSRVNRILQYLCNQPAEAKQSRFNYFRFDAIFGETSTYAETLQRVIRSVAESFNLPKTTQICIGPPHPQPPGKQIVLSTAWYFQVQSPSPPSNHIDFPPKHQLQLHPQRQQLLFNFPVFGRPRYDKWIPIVLCGAKGYFPPSPTLMGSPPPSQRKQLLWRNQMQHHFQRQQRYSENQMQHHFQRQQRCSGNGFLLRTPGLSPEPTRLDNGSPTAG